MTEFKVGDRVRNVNSGYVKTVGPGIGDPVVFGVVHELIGERVHVQFDGTNRKYGCRSSEIRHATPVPIGYTGKLRDMDLKEGDVVENGVSGAHYTMEKDKDGVLKCCLITVDESYQNYTLISRANTASTPAWSKWRMSKEDGTIQETWDEIETHPIPDMAHQVLYRGRNTSPVTHKFEVEGVVYTVDVKGGVPNWGSVVTA